MVPLPAVEGSHWEARLSVFFKVFPEPLQENTPRHSGPRGGCICSGQRTRGPGELVGQKDVGGWNRAASKLWEEATVH